jgi:excisionase family DNA binding protein
MSAAAEPIRGFTEDRFNRESGKDGTIGDMLLDRPNEPGALRVPDVAERLGVDEQTVRNWIRTGKLPATRWGPEDAKVIRVAEVDLEGLGARPAGPATLVLHVHRDRESARTVRFEEVAADEPAITALSLSRAALDQLGDPNDLTITVRAGAPPRRGRPRTPRPAT